MVAEKATRRVEGLAIRKVAEKVTVVAEKATRRVEGLATRKAEELATRRAEGLAIRKVAEKVTVVAERATERVEKATVAAAASRSRSGVCIFAADKVEAVARRTLHFQTKLHSTTATQSSFAEVVWS